MNSILKLFTFLFCLPVIAQNLVGESVEYDPIGNQFFVSSDDFSLQAVNANTEIASYIGEGLEASLGMEVMNNHLFAVQQSGVNVFDLDSNELVVHIHIDGSGFLNGMTSDGVKRVWVTDFGNGVVQEINFDFDTAAFTITEVVSGITGTPNGIVYDEPNNRLIYVTWNSATIHAIELSDYSVSELANVGLSNMDGIDEDANGNFYVSSWNPQRITRFNNDFSESETIDVPDLNNGADICYAKEIGVLAIPSTSNELILVKLEEVFPAGINDVIKNSITFWPNPVAANIQIDKQELSGTLKVRLHDLSGRLIVTLYEGSSAELSTLDLQGIPSGNYLLQIESDDRIYNSSLIKQ